MHRRFLVAIPGLSILLFGLAHAVPAGTTSAAASPISGVVSAVVDGDTLIIARAGQAPLHVRLRNIDAPELCQDGGAPARAALTELALNKPVLLRVAGRDAQGRTVAAVLLEDAVDLSVRMVEEGHAWSIRTRWDQGPLIKQERMATALHRGLHATGGAEMPWKFRVTHGPCGAAQAAVPAGSPAAIAPAKPATSATPAPPVTTAKRVPATEGVENKERPGR